MPTGPPRLVIKPPAPPAREVKHLANVAGNKLPAPTDEKLLAAIEVSTKSSAFIETSESKGDDEKKPDDKSKAGGDAAVAKVPHNCFGTESSHRQHTQLPLAKKNVMCANHMIAAKRKVGTVGYSKPATGNEFGCGTIGSTFEAMCLGYSSYLNECPSFVHDICHEDVGGSEQLRAPCPDHLTCYYCLRINPLYCLN